MKSYLLVLALIAVQSLAGAQQRTAEYPRPNIREEQEVVVNGLKEIWRLQWRTAPKLFCEPSEESLTCPCAGFAYGEVGDLWLVRLRDGAEVDRLRLTPLFTEVDGGAALQRWPVDDSEDFDTLKDADFAADVRRRPVTQVMHFADYDHNGRTTEFYLQTEAVACGHTAGVVIGISESSPRLHVFGTASHPGDPLYLQPGAWEALREAKSSPVNIVDWRCGDHGADTQTELQLQWSAAGIDGTRREYTCPEDDSEQRVVVQEKPL